MTQLEKVYRTELLYPLLFHRALNPRRMALALTAQGLATPNFDEPFAYMEMGFGQGLSLVMLAAANPHAQFYGVDLIADHVAYTEGLAKAAGLTNLHVRQQDFLSLVPSDWPAMDVIAAHGVWSWVGPQPRAAVRQFVDAALKPGGLFFVSYNVRTGWAAMVPFRDALKRAFHNGIGDAETRLKNAVVQMRTLESTQALYFRANPTVSVRLKQIEGETPGYVAHEYLNDEWCLFDVAEVATELAAIGLSYGGSTHLQDNVNDLTVRAEAIALFNAEPSLIGRETLRDVFQNKQFRRDVYVRGPRPLSAPELAILHAQMRFAAFMTPEQLDHVELKTEIASAKLNGPIHKAFVAALQAAPLTLGEVMAHPSLAAMNPNAAFGTAFLLCALGALVPATRHQALPTVDRVNAELDRRQTKAARANALVGGGWA
jgi:hypothetical protein